MTNTRIYQVVLDDDKKYTVRRLPLSKQLNPEMIAKRDRVTQGIAADVDALRKKLFVIDDGNVVDVLSDIDKTEQNSVKEQIYQLECERWNLAAELCLEGLKQNHPNLTPEKLLDIADGADLLDMIGFMFTGQRNVMEGMAQATGSFR